jgi:S1-C subfamily serine protease
MKAVTPLGLALVGLAAAALLLPATGAADDAAGDGAFVVADGDEAPGWLGITMQDLSPAMVRALGLDDDGGVLVNEVMEDSPAEKAGLEPGDVVVGLGERTVDDAADLRRAVRRHEAGETVAVAIIRDGERRTLDVELGAREQPLWQALRRAPEGWSDAWSDDDGLTYFFRGDADRGWLGVHLQDLNEQLGDYFGIEDGAGALVTEVEEDSPAAAAGLQAGDVIVALDDEEITSERELLERMSDTEPDQEVTLRIVRRGDATDVPVTLGEAPPDAGMGLGDWYAVAPRLEFRPGRGPRAFEFHGPEGGRLPLPDVRIHEHEFQELHRELQDLRDELDSLRDEIKK